MAVLEIPYPAEPPPSPYLGGMPGGIRTYEHIATGVRAELEGGVLRTPVPRAAFHAEELAGAFGLGGDFRDAWRQTNLDARDLSLPRIAEPLGLAWWRYTGARGDLRRGWPAADILIPDLLFFARREGGVATTALVWPHDARALVIPDAAELIVLRSDPSFTRAAAPVAVFVPRQEVLALAGSRTVAFSAPVPHHLYRGGASHRDIIAGVRAAAGESVRVFRAVRPDELSDSSL